MEINILENIFLVNVPVSVKDPRSSFPPLPLLVLSACLKDLCEKKNNFSYELVDFDLLLKQGKLSDSPDFYSKATSMLKEKRPKACLFTVHGVNLPIVLQFCKELKSILPDCITVLGGVAPTLQAFDIINVFPFVDVVIKGEGEPSIPQLINSILSDKDFSSVPSAVFRIDSEVIENERVYTKPDEKFTSPDYSIINLEDYLSNNRKHPYIFPGFALVESGRGCIWNCSFCAPNKMWDKNIRYRPIKEIIKEMCFLKEKGFDFSFLTQDNLEEKFIIKFCNEINNSGYELLWGCYSRLDQLSIDTGKLMARSGCKLIFVGLESPNSESQSYIRKKIVYTDLLDKIKIFNSHGISFICSFISGFPNETEVQFNNTMRFALECSSSKHFDKLLELVKDGNYNELPENRMNYCAIHPLANMPGTDSTKNAESDLRITEFPVHHDAFDTYLFGFNDFIKQYWQIAGLSFVTHLSKEKTKFYISNLRVYDFLNYNPFKFAYILNKHKMEPLDLTKEIIKDIGADTLLSSAPEKFGQLVISILNEKYNINFDVSTQWASK